MNADEIKKLGEAITKNSEFLAHLDLIEADPIELIEASQSLGLLKNSRIIEELELNSFFPGENFELLRSAIHSSNYESNTTPDIGEWVTKFKHRCEHFARASIENDAELFAVKRFIYRYIHQLTSNLKGSIRDIDSQVSNEFGHIKRLEDKIAETDFYLNHTQEILEKLNRLTYRELKDFSNHPELERIILSVLDNKLSALRKYLGLVIRKIQKLSLSFRRIELRTRRLKRILNALEEKAFQPNFESLYVEDFTGLLVKNAVPQIKAGYRLDDESFINQSRFKDLVVQISMPDVISSTATDSEKSVIERETTVEEIKAHFWKQLEACKSEFSKQILAADSPISVVSFWQNTLQLQELLSLDAWLSYANRWLEQLQKDLNGSEWLCSNKRIEKPLSDYSNIYVLSDIEINIIKGIVA
ncbi:hypothetical protein [Thiomicrorhabdus sp. Milos-T2]|uniref:hypothetical protein n=1 Tax=Thiomicrorhabdus sp. Milos-T2 TaxID=90814 RepID=UPI000494ACEC|nr:hypothetical protein [Thiomicrorhabdus sp. Milos-T2]